MYEDWVCNSAYDRSSVAIGKWTVVIKPRTIISRRKASQCTIRIPLSFARIQDCVWPGLMTHVAVGILAGILEKERKGASRSLGNYASRQPWKV